MDQTSRISDVTDTVNAQVTETETQLGRTSTDETHFHYWQPLKIMWFAFTQKMGRSPSNPEIERWYAGHARFEWRRGTPSLEDVLMTASSFKFDPGLKLRRAIQTKILPDEVVKNVQPSAVAGAPSRKHARSEPPPLQSGVLAVDPVLGMWSKDSRPRPPSLSGMPPSSGFRPYQGRLRPGSAPLPPSHSTFSQCTSASMSAGTLSHVRRVSASPSSISEAATCSEAACARLPRLKVPRTGPLPRQGETPSSSGGVEPSTATHQYLNSVPGWMPNALAGSRSAGAALDAAAARGEQRHNVSLRSPAVQPEKAAPADAGAEGAPIPNFVGWPHGPRRHSSTSLSSQDTSLHSNGHKDRAVSTDFMHQTASVAGPPPANASLSLPYVPDVRGAQLHAPLASRSSRAHQTSAVAGPPPADASISQRYLPDARGAELHAPLASFLSQAFQTAAVASPTPADASLNLRYVPDLRGAQLHAPLASFSSQAYKTAAMASLPPADASLGLRYVLDVGGAHLHSPLASRSSRAHQTSAMAGPPLPADSSLSLRYIPDVRGAQAAQLHTALASFSGQALQSAAVTGSPSADASLSLQYGPDVRGAQLQAPLASLSSRAYQTAAVAGPPPADASLSLHCVPDVRGAQLYAPLASHSKWAHEGLHANAFQQQPAMRPIQTHAPGQQRQPLLQQLAAAPGATCNVSLLQLSSLQQPPCSPALSTQQVFRSTGQLHTLCPGTGASGGAARLWEPLLPHGPLNPIVSGEHGPPERQCSQPYIRGCSPDQQREQQASSGQLQPDSAPQQVDRSRPGPELGQGATDDLCWPCSSPVLGKESLFLELGGSFEDGSDLDIDKGIDEDIRMLLDLMSE